MLALVPIFPKATQSRTNNSQGYESEVSRARWIERERERERDHKWRTNINTDWVRVRRAVLAKPVVPLTEARRHWHRKVGFTILRNSGCRWNGCRRRRTGTPAEVLCIDKVSGSHRDLAVEKRIEQRYEVVRVLEAWRVASNDAVVVIGRVQASIEPTLLDRTNELTPQHRAAGPHVVGRDVDLQLGVTGYHRQRN